MSTSNANTAAQSAQVVSFTIGDDQYGVDINAVREIKGWTKITPLPNQHDYVRGVLNLRGAMVPIIDLRCRFGQGTTNETPMHVVIVVQFKGISTGILVDRVLDIVSIEAAQIQAVPDVVASQQASLLSGLATLGDTMIALINLSNLLAQVSNIVSAGQEKTAA